MPYDDRTIRIVDATSGKVVRDLQADCEKLLSIAWSPDGSVLAAGSLDEKVRLWNPDTGKIVRSFGNSTFNELINSISWSPDSTQLACASSSSNVLVWNLNEEDQWRYFSGHTTYVHAVAWSPDGARIASADESGSVRVWDAATGEQTLTLQYPGGVSALVWHPDGKSLAAVGYGGGAAVRIWSAQADRTPAHYW
jgi:WD40 repeat protein